MNELRLFGREITFVFFAHSGILIVAVFTEHVYFSPATFQRMSVYLNSHNL